MRKKIIVAIIIIIALILLVPIPTYLKDGGSVEYKALLYKISTVHSLALPKDMPDSIAYNKGIIIEFLGFELFNNVK